MMRTSHQSASSKPPATAGPATAALTGLSDSRGGRPARQLAVLLHAVIERVGDLLQRLRVLDQARAVLEIPARAKRAALAPEHRHGGVRILVERDERLAKRIGAFRVHGIARLRARMDDRPDLALLLDAYRHGM